LQDQQQQQVQSIGLSVAAAAAAAAEVAAFEKGLKQRVMLAVDHFNKDYKKGFQFLQVRLVLLLLLLQGLRLKASITVHGASFQWANKPGLQHPT
jgi:hypothetical protein